MGLWDMLGNVANMGGMFEDPTQIVRGLLAQAQQQDQNPYGALAPMQQQPTQLPHGLPPVANPDAPQPVPRPQGLLAQGGGEEDKPAQQAQPMQGQGMPGMPSQAAGNPLQSFGDLIGGIYGKGGPGDGLIALGTGLMSKRRFGEGLQAGLDNMQKQSLIQSQNQLAQQKLTQQQAALQGRASYLKQINPNLTPEALQAIASNDTLFNDMAKRANPSEQYAQETDKDGNIWNVNKMTGQKVIALKAEADPEQPSSVKEYEYAKQNGFQGSYQDWQTQGGGGKTPATVQEYEYAKKQGYDGSFVDFQKTKAARFLDTTVSPELVDSLVAQKARGLQYPPGLARSNPGLIAAAESKFAQLYGADEGANKIVENKASNIGLAQEHRTLGAQEARAMSAANEAYGALNLLRQASASVPRTNSAWFNSAMQAYQNGAQGDPNLAALGGAIMSFKNAYARAINPNGTPHDSDKVEAAVEGRLKAATGPGALEAVMNQLETEVDMARRSPQAGRKMLLNIREGKADTTEGIDPIFKKQTIPQPEAQSAFGMVKNVLGFGNKPQQPTQAPSWRIVQ